MSYECSRCSHPDWAHSCSFCRHCSDDAAHHEFTVENTDGVRLHGKLAERSDGLSPYQHELNGYGTACADDCPAGRWLREKHGRQREALGFPPKEVVLTEQDKKFLAAQKILWLNFSHVLNDYFRDLHCSRKCSSIETVEENENGKHT